MTEIITACDNVCRDFSWLGPWVPALLGSGTALLIAFVAYPWQKRKDRDLQFEQEKRRAYADMLSAFNIHFSAIARKDAEGAKSTHAALVDKLMILQIYASRGVLREARRLTNEVNSYRSQRFRKSPNEQDTQDRQKAFKAVKAYRRALIVEMRADCSDENAANAGEVIDVFTVSEVVEANK